MFRVTRCDASGPLVVVVILMLLLSFSVTGATLVPPATPNPAGVPGSPTTGPPPPGGGDSADPDDLGIYTNPLSPEVELGGQNLPSGSSTSPADLQGQLLRWLIELRILL